MDATARSNTILHYQYLLRRDQYEISCARTLVVPELRVSRLHRHADEHSCENLPKKTAESQPKLNIPAPAPSTVPENVLAKPKPVVVIICLYLEFKIPSTCRLKPILQNLSDADRKKLDRILIMKLKMNAKATGDVPVEERIFLFVEGNHLSERKAVVVSKVRDFH
ncbi:unnamed protein product [Nippostrongylus brasiliensis]|uniref:AN1-type zinc finger protein 1 (inferred by orthology to a human protein) n=1 Tax=Nippostrongylus brasiliensis TaxID=27835 RepID=A0A0N4XSA9_NIPBR|nr:unnamed protein product [Nippostrongylus brasiliensis]